MKCWTFLKSSILGLIYKTNVNCEMNRNRGCYTIKCSHSLFISSLRIFHKANRLWRRGGPYPTPTEIEITVQEQKCTVFDSAVCQASKQIEQSRTWTWGSPYSEDTVSMMNLIIDEKSLNSGPFQYVMVINLQKNRRCMYSFCNLIFKWTSWQR